ncbi:hypothetical protein EDD85DRAFT_961174 [Armillaria nabsnona]|nr:hypothetical protein EDD85DRAFT_961174 [Armillaria nabsnona]
MAGLSRLFLHLSCSWMTPLVNIEIRARKESSSRAPSRFSLKILQDQGPNFSSRHVVGSHTDALARTLACVGYLVKYARYYRAKTTYLYAESDGAYALWAFVPSSGKNEGPKDSVLMSPPPTETKLWRIMANGTAPYTPSSLFLKFPKVDALRRATSQPRHWHGYAGSFKGVHAFEYMDRRPASEVEISEVDALRRAYAVQHHGNALIERFQWQIGHNENPAISRPKIPKSKPCGEPTNREEESYGKPFQIWSIFLSCRPFRDAFLGAKTTKSKSKNSEIEAVRRAHHREGGSHRIEIRPNAKSAYHQ